MFSKHVRKDYGVTARSKLIKCCKCSVEIEIGDEYYIRTSNRKYGRNSTQPMCVSCYESLFITVT